MLLKSTSLIAGWAVRTSSSRFAKPPAPGFVGAILRVATRVTVDLQSRRLEEVSAHSGTSNRACANSVTPRNVVYFEMWCSVAYPTWYSYPFHAKRVMAKLGKCWRRQEEALRKVIEKSVAFCYFHLTSTLARQQPPRLGISK